MLVQLRPDEEDPDGNDDKDVVELPEETKVIDITLPDVPLPEPFIKNNPIIDVSKGKVITNTYPIEPLSPNGTIVETVNTPLSLEDLFEDE